ncbi:MAG: DNA-binding protein [Bacillota bacterium]|nr:DNA-binding protein [Bacillota bacterium]MDW7683928.1 DNA-binding protein [Bacillota bacterium]
MIKEYSKGRVFLGRLPFGGDLLAEAEKLAAQLQIKVGFLRIIGAVAKGTYAFYDQNKRTYQFHSLDEHLEIVSCIGNLTFLDGREKAHLHITYSDKEGRCFGGHLSEGTVIFAAEFYLEELLGEELHRCHDEETGLPLWKKERYV